MNIPMFLVEFWLLSAITNKTDTKINACSFCWISGVVYQLFAILFRYVLTRISNYIAYTLCVRIILSILFRLIYHVVLLYVEVHRTYMMGISTRMYFFSPLLTPPYKG